MPLLTKQQKQKKQKQKKKKKKKKLQRDPTAAFSECALSPREGRKGREGKGAKRKECEGEGGTVG